jgi:hypothetical protein
MSMSVFLNPLSEIYNGNASKEKNLDRYTSDSNENHFEKMDFDLLKSCLDFLFDAAMEQNLTFADNLICAASDAVQDEIIVRKKTS